MSPRSQKPAAGGNRTDLLVPGGKPAPPGGGQPNGLPIQVPTGGPYGEAQSLQQQQQAVAGGSGQPPTPPPPTQSPASEQPPPNPQQMIENGKAAAKDFSPPNLGELTRPTERPHEHVMTPPAASNPLAPQPAPGGGMAAMLMKMAQATDSPGLSQLAARASSLGQ